MAKSFLELVTIVDNSPYTGIPEGVYRLFTHDDVLIGKVAASVVPALEPVLFLRVDHAARAVRITQSTGLDSKFAALCAQWRAAETFECLKGWRDELYAVYTHGGSRYFSIERSAAALFGLVTYGCHITGYNAATRQIWVPRRSYTKQTYPGMLDNTVAGGLGDGLGFWATAIKECGEEAGLGAEFVEQHLQQVGVISYEFVDPVTGYFQPEVECVYDLHMPSGVTPQPTDGEVHEFLLLGYEEVQERLRRGEFKYNTAVVLIDFFVRHGEITAESEPEYFELVSRSHRRLEYPLSRRSCGAA